MIIVTGASGFIGWPLTEELIKKGYKVLAITRSGKAPEGAETLQQDLRKPISLAGNIEAVIHLAAQASAKKSFEEGWNTFENNILPVINIAKLALEKHATLILASSAEVYGATSQPHIKYKEEECLTLRPPFSPYSLTKIVSELIVHHYILRGLKTIIMRPTNTYGRLLFDQSQQAKEYFIEKAITLMQSNVPELAFDGYGESARQWLYFPDHVSAYTTVLEKSEPQPLEIYNVAGPETKTLKEVITTLQQLTGWNGKVKWGLNPRPIDPNYLIVDTQKLYTLGWRPLYDLQKGLSNYLERLRHLKGILHKP
jgi:dTDP-glucose 4,6-dehydratase